MSQLCSKQRKQLIIEAVLTFYLPHPEGHTDTVHRLRSYFALSYLLTLERLDAYIHT